MQSSKNSTPRVALIALLGFLAFAPLAEAATLAEAMGAYRSNQVAAAEAMLTAIAADPAAAAADRAEALRELGRIDWLVRGETNAAAAALAQATAGPERCATLLMALRVFREAGAPEDGLGEAARSRGECTSAEADSMRVALARAHLELAGLAPADSAAHLAAAASELAALAPSVRRAPDVASANFSLALAQRDPTAALRAWRDYFWLTDDDAPQAMSAYAGRVAAIFAAGLAGGAAEPDRIALVDMLIYAGFADEARNVAGAIGDAPGWRRARAYFAFHHAVESTTLRANREIAAGGRAQWYEAEIRAAMGALMQASGLDGDPVAALRQAFGLFGTLGETSGYPSLHAGHLVQDEALGIEQYGRSGRLRFVVLDNMLANGFESWLWDGWAETGGWSESDGAIVQVRSAYTDGPLAALRRARAGSARDRFLANIERAAIDEHAALGRDGVAQLPAASDRLELQAIDQIAARAGDDDGGFIAEHWRETVHYSITLHEGRHALDKAVGHFSETSLEFRAKLSQIALSDYPRLGLANVAGGNIDNTSHGRANRQILEGYRAWMRRHRGEVAGFDPSQPTLSQLPLLTDDQIRTIARGLDPWAR